MTSEAADRCGNSLYRTEGQSVAISKDDRDACRAYWEEIKAQPIDAIVPEAGKIAGGAAATAACDYASGGAASGSVDVVCGEIGQWVGEHVGTYVANLVDKLRDELGAIGCLKGTCPETDCSGCDFDGACLTAKRAEIFRPTFDSIRGFALDVRGVGTQQQTGSNPNESMVEAAWAYAINVVRGMEQCAGQEYFDAQAQNLATWTQTVHQASKQRAMDLAMVGAPALAKKYGRNSAEGFASAFRALMQQSILNAKVESDRISLENTLGAGAWSGSHEAAVDAQQIVDFQRSLPARVQASPSPPSRSGRWLAVGAVVIVGGVAAYHFRHDLRRIAERVKRAVLLPAKT